MSDKQRYQCPSCHGTFELYLATKGVHGVTKPRPRDMAVCGLCHQLLQFVDDHTLKAVPEDLAQRLRKDDQRALDVFKQGHPRVEPPWHNPCPQCGEQLNEHRTAHGPEHATPRQGDVALCAHCGTLLEFAQDLTLMRMTDTTRASLPLDQLASMEHMRNTVLGEETSTKSAWDA